MTARAEQSSFLDGANPVLAAALFPRPQPGELPVVVLVVDDSEDDELVSVISDAGMVPASDYGGAWAAQTTGGALTLKFHLIRLGGSFERAWTLPDPPAETLEAIVDGDHHVAVLPRELAGDLSILQPAMLGGSIIVEAQPSSAAAAAREVAARLTQD